MKILTNIRFVQTAGIAQTLFSFLDFIEKGERNDIQVVGINVVNKDKESYRKRSKRRTAIISIGLKVPSISKTIKKIGKLEDIEKRYSKVINGFQRAIREEKPDLVLINGTYYLPWCLLLASQRENASVVLHYHGVLTKEAQGYGVKQREIFREMERCFDSKDIFYIFPSQITKRVVEKDVFGHQISRYKIVPNSVPLYFHNPKTDNFSNKVGIVSRYARIKNMDFIRKLAEHNQNRGGKFEINLITDVSSNSGPLKKWVKMINICKPVNNKALPSFYQKMGVVISPSHFETYGNVAKEALASGTPAIVSNNMGVSETFKKLGLENLIVSFDSVKSVYEKIEKEIGKEIKESIRSKIKKLYSPSKIFSTMLKELEKVNCSRVL